MSNKIRTGWVYVLVNDSIADQVKVGFTSGHPEDRAKELRGSGVPTPYKVATAFLFADKAYQIEQKAHALLKGCRVSPDREFFRCSLADASDAIRIASDHLNEAQSDILDAVPTAEERSWTYYKRGLVKKNIKDQVRWWLEAAKLGHAGAQGFLGLYYAGAREEQDYRLSASWAEKAAEQGDMTGQRMLGNLYMDGKGVEKNWRKGMQLYRAAAEQGDAKAQFYYGLFSAVGKGVEKNREEAVKWYRKSAEQGYAEAQNSLGDCYNYGSGVEQNHEEAVRSYRKAAEQGHAESQKNLDALLRKAN